LDLILFNFRKQLKATPHVKFQRSSLARNERAAFYNA